MKHPASRLLFLISVSLLLLPGIAFALGGGDGNPNLKIPQESLKEWRSLRVGAFIHWSPYVMGIGQPRPAEGFEDLYKTFKAERFDPEEWVQLFKDAGLKYIVFTTKHGDGYSMWDTKESDRNVMNTAMKRDVVGELVAACRKQGVEFCPYYAVENFMHPDWTNNLDPKTGKPDFISWRKDWNAPTYPDAYHVPAGEPDFDRYIKHMKAQMKELTEKYGPFRAWWFDQAAPSWTHERGTDFYAYMRSLQSDVLVSNRVDTSRERGLDYPTWFVNEEKSAGDYALSEIAIPRFTRDIAWEYCRYAGKDGVSFYWNPEDVYKPLNEWTMDLVNSACRDGNFLIGIGPMPDGRFEPRLADQLRQLGTWLKYYGDSIYGTRGGPFMPTNWYGSTCKGNKVYVHIFKTDDKQTLTLPPLPRKVRSYHLMNGGAIDLKQTDTDITMTISKYDMRTSDTIAVLELDGSAEELTPVDAKILNKNAQISASNFRESKKEFSPETTVDGNNATYWTTDNGVTEGWIQYDLGKPCTFSRAILDEGDDGWIRHLQIQIKVGKKWNNAFEYRHGAPELWVHMPIALFSPEFRFAPVTAQLVRVKILSATQSPVVREFKLYER